MQVFPANYDSELRKQYFHLWTQTKPHKDVQTSLVETRGMSLLCTAELTVEYMSNHVMVSGQNGLPTDKALHQRLEPCATRGFW